MTLEQPQFSLIVVKDYYDGPMSGVAISEPTMQAVFFRVVAWDSEQWQRVYAVTALDPPIATELVDALTVLEVPSKPLWVVGPASVTPATSASWRRVRDSAQRSADWWLIQSHDLTDIAERAELSRSQSKAVASMISEETVVNLNSGELLEEFRTTLDSRPGG